MGGSGAIRLGVDRVPEEAIGGKAAHVLWLISHGYRVPDTWVVPADVPLPDPEAVVTWLPDDGLAGDASWAVRSSASVEDGPESSYAGQFATVLDVSGAASVSAAIDQVRRSATGPIATAYQSRIGNPGPFSMAVMVQRMIAPKVSGVAFSRNPITGLNETVIEAVSGRGDSFVADGVTPQRWIRRWGAWSDRPGGAEILPEDVVVAIAADTSRIADEFGAAVDLEWVWDGAEVWWVQLRPITGLSEIPIYSNRISREVMPGMIKPLVWSVNVPVVNRAWIELFGELIGPSDLDPDDLAKSFAYRSYFDMGTIGRIFERLGMPRDSLEMLLGLPSASRPGFRPSAATLLHVPRMVIAMARKARYGKRVDPEVASLLQRFSRFDGEDVSALSDSGILAKIDELAAVTSRAAYANIVTPLLANAYVAMLRRTLRKHGLEPDGLDLELVDPSNPYDPNPALARLGRRLDGLGPDARSVLEREGPAGLPDDLHAEFEGFLERFGHLSDSGNDFSVVPWMEQKEAVLRLALDHRETTGDHRPPAASDATARLGWASRRTVRFWQGRASEFVNHREAVSFVYTYGYGLFRPYYLEVGRRLASRRVIAQPDDVMYLYSEEVRSALLDGDTPSLAADLVAIRKAEMADLADLDMPEIIFGDDFVPARHSSAPGSRLEGVATSRGRHRGTVRVIRGIEDGPRVEPGDVIAIPFSDVGWTPLFARAGAVVAEAGGMLSHSSIVAREYRIPCVVSVDGATRLPDGATVVVDGYTGTVVVEEPPS